MGTNYSCSFLRNSDEVSLGHHDITIQALLNNTVYGEITERFFVFQSTHMFHLFDYVFVSILLCF